MSAKLFVRVTVTQFDDDGERTEQSANKVRDLAKPLTGDEKIELAESLLDHLDDELKFKEEQEV